MNLLTNGIRILFSIIGLGLGNACFYRLMNGDCYELKTISHYISFSLISIGCNFGYFFVASTLSDKFKKLAVFFLIPSFVIVPSFLSAWFPTGQYVALASALAAVIFVFRESIYYALGSMERKR